MRLEVSQVAPWFGQSGGGVQYRFLDADGKPLPHWKLKERDILTESELRAVRDALVAQGLVEGMDFAVLGTGDPTALSSEIVLLRGDLDGWHVDYRDMGVNRELLLTDDFERATARFVDEAHALAAGRGRGPRATVPERTRSLEELREDHRAG